MSSNDINTIPNESRVPQILAGIIVPTILSTLFVLARLYTRAILTKNWGHDDTLVTLAWLVSIGLAITNALLVPFGGGHHQIFQPLSFVVPTLKLAFIGRLIYQCQLCLTKLGICVFYLRVFQDKHSRYWVYGLIAFSTISAVVIELVFVFQCSPVSDAWGLVNPNCKSARPSTIANAVANIIADLGLMVFVIPRVLPLQMARRQKASLLVVVSLGILVIAASIVRCDLVVRLADNSDPTWNGYDVTTWTSLEVSTGLFCASAPAIRPLLRKVAPGFMSSISQTFSGPSKGRTTAQPGSKYGIGSKYGAGTITGKPKRGELYELNSRGTREGEITFWVEDEEMGKRGGSGSGSDDRQSDEVSVLGSGGLERNRGLGGQSSIVKTVVVEVSNEVSSRRASQSRAAEGWANV